MSLMTPRARTDNGWAALRVSWLLALLLCHLAHIVDGRGPLPDGPELPDSPDPASFNENARPARSPQSMCRQGNADDVPRRTGPSVCLGSGRYQYLAPTVFILGGRRAGTTILAQALTRLSGGVLRTPFTEEGDAPEDDEDKEPDTNEEDGPPEGDPPVSASRPRVYGTHFFVRSPWSPTKEDTFRYVSHFPACPHVSHLRVGLDASEDYLATLTVPGNLHLMFPRLSKYFRFLAVIRDPVARTLSWFNSYGRTHARIPCHVRFPDWLRVAIPATRTCAMRRAVLNTPRKQRYLDCWETLSQPTNASLPAGAAGPASLLAGGAIGTGLLEGWHVVQVEEWLRLFRKRQILFLSFRDLVADAATQADTFCRVFDFLGIPGERLPPRTVYRADGHQLWLRAQAARAAAAVNGAIGSAPAARVPPICPPERMDEASRTKLVEFFHEWNQELHLLADARALRIETFANLADISSRKKDVLSQDQGGKASKEIERKERADNKMVSVLRKIVSGWMRR